MDKRSPKILIKVNGTETEYKEEAAKQSAPQEEFQWVLPSEQQISHHNVVPFRAGSELPAEPKKRRGRSRTVAITIGTAVLLGTGFGFGVLHVLDNSKVKGPNAAAVPTAAAPATTPATDKQQNVSEKTQQSAALEKLTMYMIQGNVFSTAERGQAALEDMKANGMPGALITSSGKTILYIGLASDEKGAKKLEASYKEKGVSALEKQRVIEAQQVPKALQKYSTLLVQAETSLRTLIEQSSAVYVSGQVDAKQWSELQKNVQELTKQGKSVNQAEIKKLLTYVSLSNSALQQYKDKKDEKTFVKLQQLLLDGFISYETAVVGKGSS